MRAVLSRALAALVLAAALLPAAAVLPAGGLRADPPRERPASEADEGEPESADRDRQEDGRRLEAPPPPRQGTRILTLAEKACRQRHGCANPAAACRPCDR